MSVVVLRVRVVEFVSFTRAPFSFAKRRYHLAPADGNPDVTTCMPTICGIDEHVVNYECEPCPANKTNAGGDFAPLNNTACDEVYVEHLPQCLDWMM